jgi:hypothetical protein
MQATASRSVLGILAGVFLGAAGCNAPSNKAYTGHCQPTVEGCPAGTYGSYEAARKAFGRMTPDGAFQAFLEDVAWLRYEGDEEEVVKKHRPYFDQGYTTFAITLFTKDFVQPTTETYVLEDSGGARLTARPQTYSGNMGLENERYAARFSVSFRHAITRDLEWIRLTRAADGASLEWRFGAEDAQAAPVAGVSAVPGHAAAPRALPRAQPLRRPLHPAPGACDPGQRPVNLLTHPELAPPRGGAPASPPPEPPATPSPADPTLQDPGASAVPPPVAPGSGARPGTP